VTDMHGRPAVSDEKRLQRRDEIMAAAKKVFARNGFHATTIADVANEAKLPFDVVYQYFDSKDVSYGAPAADHRRRRHRGRSRRFHRLVGSQGVATGLEPARARTHNSWSASFAPGRNFTGVAN
jgi:AcrR family transcriptional regulator